jgi:hypothetical protein
MATWVVGYVSGWKSMPADTLLPGEDRNVSLTGYVFLIKHAKDDCDLHLEIAGTRSAAGRRIVAEVPPTDPEMQVATLKLLGLAGLSPGSQRVYEAADAPHVTISGLAFLDVSHQLTLVDKKTGKKRSIAQLKKGNKHGTAKVATLWEVHPVVSIRSAK